MSDLGRRHGVFVPAAEIEAHLICGWEILECLSAHAPWPGVCAPGWFDQDGALMSPPAREAMA